MEGDLSHGSATEQPSVKKTSLKLRLGRPTNNDARFTAAASTPVAMSPPFIVAPGSPVESGSQYTIASSENTSTLAVQDDLARTLAELRELQEELARPLPSTRPSETTRLSSSKRKRPTDAHHDVPRASPKTRDERRNRLYSLPRLGEPGEATLTSCKSFVSLESDCLYGSQYAKVGSNAASDDILCNLPMQLSTGSLYSCTCCVDAFDSYMRAAGEELVEHSVRIQRGIRVRPPSTAEADVQNYDPAILAAVVASWGAESSGQPSLKAVARQLHDRMLARKATYTYDRSQDLFYVFVSMSGECSDPGSSLDMGSIADPKSGPLAVFVDVDKCLPSATVLDVEAEMAEDPHKPEESMTHVKHAGAPRSKRTPRKPTRHEEGWSEDLILSHLLRIGYTSPTIVEDQPDRGRVVLAGAFIPRGAFVTEYRGQLLTLEEAKSREAAYSSGDFGSYMFFFAHNGHPHCVDATAERPEYGIGRLINHSRKHPNLAPRVVTVDGIPRLALIAKKDIHYSTELLYDYGEKDKEILQKFAWIKNS